MPQPEGLLPSFLNEEEGVPLVSQFTNLFFQLFDLDISVWFEVVVFVGSIVVVVSVIVVIGSTLVGVAFVL